MPTVLGIRPTPSTLDFSLLQPGALTDDLIQLCGARLDLVVDQLYGKLILLGQFLPGGGETLLNAFLGLSAAAAQTVLQLLHRGRQQEHGGSAREPNLSQGIDWKSFWRQSAAQCPLKLADGVSVEKITISGNIVMLDLILTNYSADQVTDEMIEALVKVKDLLRKTSKMPSNTTLRINAYDQYREKITTL